MNRLDELAARLDHLREESFQRELRRQVRQRTGSHIGLIGAQRATVRRANRARALREAHADVIDLRERTRVAAQPVRTAPTGLRLWTREGDAQLNSM